MSLGTEGLLCLHRRPQTQYFQKQAIERETETETRCSTVSDNNTTHRGNGGVDRCSNVQHLIYNAVLHKIHRILYDNARHTKIVQKRKREETEYREDEERAERRRESKKEREHARKWHLRSPRFPGSDLTSAMTSAVIFLSRSRSSLSWKDRSLTDKLSTFFVLNPFIYSPLV